MNINFFKKISIFNLHMKKLKLIIEKSRINFMNINPIFMGIILFLKSMILVSMIESSEFKTIYIKDFFRYYGKLTFIPHFAIILLIISFGFILKDKKRTYFLIGIDIVISILFLANINYWRIAGRFLSIRQLLNLKLFNPLDKLLFNFKIIDLIFIIDTICFMIMVKFNKENKYESKRRIKSFLLIAIISVCTLLKYSYLLDKQDITKGSQYFIHQD